MLGGKVTHFVPYLKNMAMLNVSQLQNDKAERILPDGASRVLSYNLTCHDVNIWTNSFYNKDSIKFYSEFCLFVCLF